MRKSTFVTFVHLLVVSEAIWWALNESREMVSKQPNDAQDNGDAKKASQAGMHASGHLVGLMAEIR